MHKSLFDWRRVLIYTHRWLGILCAGLFVAWFASGIVMMYAGMPTLRPDERLRHLPRLDLSAVRVNPESAVTRYGLAPDRFQVSMLDERPVYRFIERDVPTTVFADNGVRLEPLTRSEALAAIVRWVPKLPDGREYQFRMVEPDQWTLQSQQFMPLHKISLGDPEHTYLYVSDRTGEPVMKTTRKTRGLAYVGPVLHWLYFTPLRVHTTMWIQLVIWLSIVGCVLCLSGLLWGIWRWSPVRRFRLKTVRSRTPYVGLMRWHHYAGLVFGLSTFTWTLSGGLSLDPWAWHPPNSPTAAQRTAVAGGSLNLNLITANALQEGVEAYGNSPTLKEVEVGQFQGEPFLIASVSQPQSRADSEQNLTAGLFEKRLVSIGSPQAGPFTGFEREKLDQAARLALAGTKVVDSTWLEQYDAYYYGRAGSRSLPVLRVRFDDAQGTWLYLDPKLGRITLREERLTRLNRWLYHGLHSLDFPFLYSRRPLWDVVVIVLSLGGMVLAISSAGNSFRRLRRHGRRIYSVLK